MNTSDITKLLHQREPYLMVSEITECDQKKIIANFKIIGFPDEYMVNGSQSDVLDYYNMSPKTLAEIAKNLIS